MSERQYHTRSGMGTDIDPIRLASAAGALWGLGRGWVVHSGWLFALGVVCLILLVWWVTRCWYLDKIEDLKRDQGQT